MGYRSDVTIRCKEEAFNRLKAAWVDESANGRNINPTSIKQINDEYYIQWVDIKWYSEFPEVMRINSVLDELIDEYTEETPELGFCECIIGEDVDDITHLCNTYDLWIDVLRKAYIPDGKDVLS